MEATDIERNKKGPVMGDKKCHTREKWVQKSTSGRVVIKSFRDSNKMPNLKEKVAGNNHKL